MSIHKRSLPLLRGWDFIKRDTEIQRYTRDIYPKIILHKVINRRKQAVADNTDNIQMNELVLTRYCEIESCGV